MFARQNASRRFIPWHFDGPILIIGVTIGTLEKFVKIAEIVIIRKKCLPDERVGSRP